MRGKTRVEEAVWEPPDMPSMTRGARLPGAQRGGGEVAREGCWHCVSVFVRRHLRHLWWMIFRGSWRKIPRGWEGRRSWHCWRPRRKQGPILVIEDSGQTPPKFDFDVSEHCVS